jgi:hypothetical protein
MKDSRPVNRWDLPGDLITGLLSLKVYKVYKVESCAVALQ